MLGEDSEPESSSQICGLLRAGNEFSTNLRSPRGARLIRAFLRITDPGVRAAIVHMVEKMGSAPADCRRSRSALVTKPRRQPLQMLSSGARPGPLRAPVIPSAWGTPGCGRVTPVGAR